MTPLECPHCGSDKVVSNVTIRWNQTRGAFVPGRASYCTSCGKGFHRRPPGEFGFRTVRVKGMTRALWRLQQSGDLIVVRHRNGVTEVLF